MSKYWYGTARWQRLRASQLQAEPLCRYCSQTGRVTDATVADHVVPHKGDPDLFWHGELQSLCDTCHNSVKQREEKGQTIAGCTADGMPLDVSHHWNQSNRGGG